MRRTANDKHGRIGDFVHIRAVAKYGLEARFVHTINQSLHFVGRIQRKTLRACDGFGQILHSQHRRQFDSADGVFALIHLTGVQHVSGLFLKILRAVVTQFFTPRVQSGAQSIRLFPHIFNFRPRFAQILFGGRNFFIERLGIENGFF